MPLYDARLVITLKPGVLDPQGKASAGALASLGFEGVRSVRQGKVMDLEIEAADEAAARTALAAMCERLLANTVIENHAVDRLTVRGDG